MPRRNPTTRQSVAPSIAPGRAIDLIRQQIDRLDNEVAKLSFDDPKVEAWESTTTQILNAAFGMPDGESERRTQDFRHASSGMQLYMGMSDDEIQRDYVGIQKKRRALLEAYIEQLQILVPGPQATVGVGFTVEAGPGAEPAPSQNEGMVAMNSGSRNVFLVHGRNDAVRESVARFLERLELQPVILHEQPNKGRTIIEKFEAHSDVGFAVVLLTADDMGTLASEDHLRPRARQNVILELGYFIGKLGRARVCAVYVEGVELPSDIHGILYVPYDNSNGWRLKLANEIRAAGIAVDLNRA